MRLEKFTIKSQEALQEARYVAENAKHQQLQPVHLLKALIGQKEGIVIPLLAKIGVSINTISNQTDTELSKLPVIQSGIGDIYLSPELNKVLEQSEKEA
ncbi:MAG: Clp protease N-terminal domain-containing protein, partial [Planctomycetota bacterium]